MSAIQKFLTSNFMSCFLGLILIAYGVYDIYEELFEPTHEHILILIGFLLVVNAVAHTQEGVLKLASVLRKDKENSFLEKMSKMFNLPFVRTVLAVAVMIASIYSLDEDLTNLHSKTVSFTTGMLLLVPPIIGLFLSGNKLSKGVKKNSSKVETSESE